ncbi:MAG: uroporphyrinogen decarboxylase, partial [Eubacterium sp.]
MDNIENTNQTTEKNTLFEDVFDGKIPKRVPILSSGDNAFCLDYAGFDLRKEQYSIEKNLEAIDRTTADFEMDSIFATMVR